MKPFLHVITENTCQESWIVMADFPSYAVSDFGRVKRVTPHQRGGTNTYIGKILKPQISRKGYFKYRLMRAGKLHSTYSHLLVARTFILNTDPSLEVDHIDGNKLNNHVSNLEYVTHRENTRRYTARFRPLTGAKKRINRWKSKIYFEGKYISLGSYETEIEAHKVYLNAKYEIECGTFDANKKYAHNYYKGAPHSNHCKGSAHPKAKLTDDDVLEIIKSTEQTKILVRKYNVGRSAIKAIRSGTTWKHLHQQVSS